MRKNIISSTLVLIFSLAAQADKVCSEEHYVWNGTKCVTVGTSAGVATLSGAYSIKKYSSADSVEKEHTKRIFDAQSGSMSSERSFVIGATRSVQEGDRVTLYYQLSEAENRAHHIQLQEDAAAVARSSASYHSVQALTATKSVYEVEDDGNGGTHSVYKGEEPDWAARAMHASMAVSENERADRHLREAEKARRGGAVPIYTFNNRFDGDADTARKTADFANERLSKGGKVIAIDRLPAAQLKVVRSLVNHGRAGIVGVAIGMGAVAEEVVAGKIAQKIESRGRSGGYAPERRSYDNSWNK